MLTSIIVGSVGVLGVGGTVAAAYFFPTIVMPLLSAAWTKLLGCKPCLIAIAIFAAAVAGNIHGHRKEAAKCRAADLEAQLRNQRIDLQIARDAAADASKRATNIEEWSNAQQKKDADYIASLKARPACNLTADDLGDDGVRERRTRRTIPSAGAR